MDFRLEECRTEDDVREVLHRYVNFYNKQRPLPLIMIRLTTTVNVLIAMNWNIEIPFRSVC